MMIRNIKLLTATVVLCLLSACGGGGGGGGATLPTPTPVVDPKITVYQTFDLSNSVLTGNSASDGVLQGCSLLSNPATTQINLMNVKFDENRNTVRYNFILDGSFFVPNVASGCNTTGITGTITGVTLMANGNPAYTISSLAIDAGSFKLGQQIFWGNVLKQTG
jgi:hypothetical protein